MFVVVAVHYLKMDSKELMDDIMKLALDAMIRPAQLNMVDKKLYKKHSTFFSDYIGDTRALLENLFERYNGEEGRERSMSVGDVIQLDERYYIALGQGFKEIQMRA